MMMTIKVVGFLAVWAGVSWALWWLLEKGGPPVRVLAAVLAALVMVLNACIQEMKDDA